MDTRGTKEFYKRRLQRILPPHLIVLITYGIVKVIFWKYSVWDYYYENSLFAFLTHGYTLGWFVSGILVLYAITPLLYKLLKKSKVGYWMLFCGILLSTSQIGFIHVSDIFYNIHELLLNRIPIYMVGLACGEYIKAHEDDELKINAGFIIGSLVLISLFFWNSFCNVTNVMDICHYLAILIAPMCCIWMAWFFNKFPCPSMQHIGRISLETYLLNEKIGILLYVYLPKSDNYIINLLAFVLTIFGADILRRVCNGFRKNKSM